MDYKQLLKDLVTLNFGSFATRRHKLAAVLKRRLLLRPGNSAACGDFYNVPIIINNYNRLSYLKQLVDWLQQAGYSNLHILDNGSSYAPLLEYYKSAGVNVIYLKNNYGHLAFWKSGVYKRFYRDYYVYTDPDVVPVKECPHDFMAHFFRLLTTYAGIEKVGFGLKIDDLPDHYEKKQEVIAWEQKFWNRPLAPDVYDAPVDTTFALYKPFTRGDIWVQNALRTGGPYQLHHLPWYEDSANLSAESRFYLEHIKKGASHWIVNQQQK